MGLMITAIVKSLSSNSGTWVLWGPVCVECASFLRVSHMFIFLCMLSHFEFYPWHCKCCVETLDLVVSL